MPVFKELITIILAFALGVTFTLFCMRLRNSRGGRKKEDGCDH